MTKRLTAVLTALMILFSLPALAETQYGAWTIEVSDLTLTAGGEEIEVEPSLILRVGFSDDHDRAWLAADVTKGGETLGGFRAEEERDGASRCAWVPGEAVAVMSGKGDASLHALLTRELGMKERPDSLAEAVDMVDAFLNMPKGVEYLFSHLGSIKKMGKSQYAVRLDLPDGRADFALSWRWERRAKKPFDLAGLSEVKGDPAGGLAGLAGYDEFEAALMEDESMEELLIALMLMFGE